ncbi:hypothetical protein ACFE04_013922 [Oxalis oulophora]
MALFNNDDLQYVIDDYFDVPDFEEHDEPLITIDDEDSDFEQDFQLTKSKNDTTASEARNGKDMQGIPWERLNFTRDKYREHRLKHYKNYESLSRSHDPELHKDQDYLQVEKGKTFYDFHFNTRLVKSTIAHFQLRNLLWASSKHDVYFVEHYSVKHWSSMRQRTEEVLNMAKPITPTFEHPGLLSQSVSRVQISATAVKDNFMVIGGFHGELLCKHVNKAGVSFCTKITGNEDAIINCVDVYRNPNGSMRIIAGNNDAEIRIFDADNFTCLNRFSFDWSVNNTSVSPDGKSFAVLGDSKECLLADAQSGKVTGSLKGHIDYSFTSAWHPNGQILATGNQDTTCRLWDIRNLSESFAVLKGRMGAIRGLKFTTDGRFLAMAEPADFVHIFDSGSDYIKCQEIDLFGEISGISFSPDTEAIFVGVCDRSYGSLLEFNRRRSNQYLESIY